MSKMWDFWGKMKKQVSSKLNSDSNIGQGHKLNESSTSRSTGMRQKKHHDVYKPPKRSDLSEEASTAAAAAISRMEKNKPKELNVCLAAIRAKAKQEIEAEKGNGNEMKKNDAYEPHSQQAIVKKIPACEGVFFRCPLISEEILPKDEWHAKIKDFLLEQLDGEPALTACLLIYNCNPENKIDSCVQTLSKYLENIIMFPEMEKFRKIRMSNKVFCEKVRCVEGAVEFLYAAGFEEAEIDDENYLLFSNDSIEKGFDLTSLLEVLRNSERIPLELDRNINVLFPSQVANMELPKDFFRISLEDVKLEQQRRREDFENSQVLKTKAMRRNEHKGDIRMYQYALVRIKFPNGLFLQGTFGVYETISSIFEFVRNCLFDESTIFSLIAPGNIKLNQSDMDKTLYEMHFIPNIVLLFGVTGATTVDGDFLKDDILILARDM